MSATSPSLLASSGSERGAPERGAPERIVLVAYAGFESPGVIHLYYFAHELVRLGRRVLVLLNGDPAGARAMAVPPAFPIIQIFWQDGRLARSTLGPVLALGPEVVHAWTPRHVPARAALEIAGRTGAALFIHYEDDEDYLYRYFSRSWGVDLLADRARLLRTLAIPDDWNWQHPVVSPLAAHCARGLTAICKPYVARLERDWGKPVHLLYPGVDLTRFHPDVAPVDRTPLGLAGKTVLLYSGALHGLLGFDRLLEAFARIAPRWPDAVLVQFGRVFIADQLALEVRRLGLRDRVRFLGPIDHHQVPRYLALGDVLVQSGEPGDFDEYRLPSKLPEYFAMGRAVVTFAAGIGREFEDGVNVLKTYSGDVAELADCLERALGDAALRERVGRAGRTRAEELFSWPRNAAGLADFYTAVLQAPAAPPDPRAAARHWPDFVLADSRAAGASRCVLLVASDALALPGLTPGPSGRRAAALAAALDGRGHRTVQAMPADACPHDYDLRPHPAVRLWQAGTLPFTAASVRADAVIVCGERAQLELSAPGGGLPPVAIDLAGVWPFAPDRSGLDDTKPDRSPERRQEALGRARCVILPADADGRAAWLPWALVAGLEAIDGLSLNGAPTDAPRASEALERALRLLE
jgi:glycosyltransferase involved in cell wall biosynthesis